ncbi:MAG: hypothetical protein LBT47_02425 [Deltaproteobacteria bacterium]|jgi:nucleoside-diphosphate-sugar epimerase|nr:hypothetical protein [Deltaproteobacteria bacterium]
MSHEDIEDILENLVIPMFIGIGYCQAAWSVLKEFFVSNATGWSWVCQLEAGIFLRPSVIEPVIVRLVMVFGPGDPNRRFHDIIEAIQNDCDITLPADFAAWKTCYTGDNNIAQGLALAAENGETGELYNLADQEIFTQAQCCELIAGLLNRKIKITITTEKSETVNYAQNLVLDSAKIRRQLGYTELHPAFHHWLNLKSIT